MKQFSNKIAEEKENCMQNVRSSSSLGNYTGRELGNLFEN